MSAEDKIKWLQQVQDARSCYEAPDDPDIRQIQSQQAYMNNHLITNGSFTFVPNHVQPVAIQDNLISTDYLVDAMSSYLATSGSLSATSVSATLVALETVAPLPPANDDPIVVAAPSSKQQWTLDDLCFPAASVAAAPVAVENVAPVPPTDDDPIIVSAPASKQQRTLDYFWSPAASVAAAPAAVKIVAPDPLPNDDPIVVVPPGPKQRQTLCDFLSSL